MGKITANDVEALIAATFTEKRPDAWEDDFIDRYCFADGPLCADEVMTLSQIPNYGWSPERIDELIGGLREDDAEELSPERIKELEGGAPLTAEEQEAFGRAVETWECTSDTYLDIYRLSPPEGSSETRCVYFILHWGPGGMGPERIGEYGPLRDVEEVKEALAGATMGRWIIVNDSRDAPDTNAIAIWVQEDYDAYAQYNNALTRKEWEARRSNVLA